MGNWTGEAGFEGWFSTATALPSSKQSDAAAHNSAKLDKTR
jgi:hypothetical protein